MPAYEWAPAVVVSSGRGMRSYLEPSAATGKAVSCLHQKRFSHGISTLHRFFEKFYNFVKGKRNPKEAEGNRTKQNRAEEQKFQDKSEMPLQLCRRNFCP